MNFLLRNKIKFFFSKLGNTAKNKAHKIPSPGAPYKTTILCAFVFKDISNPFFIYFLLTISFFFFNMCDIFQNGFTYLCKGELNFECVNRSLSNTESINTSSRD